MNTEKKQKDIRKVFRKEKIDVAGEVVSFDGKGDPKSKVLKVYRYFGNINLLEEAFQNFSIINGYKKVVFI